MIDIYKKYSKPFMLRISYGKNCHDFKSNKSVKIGLRKLQRACDFRILRFRNHQFLKSRYSCMMVCYP